MLPKAEDQSAYYSRQLHLFNFTVVRMVPSKKLGNANVTSYVWTEDERPRRSCEIASAIYDTLTSLHLEGVNTIRLFSNGCGEQNKNITMIGIATAWLNQAPSHVTKITLHFPVTGHSFLPP